MPLFGSKHNKHNDATNTSGGGHHHHADNQGLNNNPGEGTGAGMGPGFPQQQGMGGAQQQGMGGVGQTGGRIDEQALPGGGRHNRADNQGLNNNPGGGTGVGMGPGFPQQQGMGGAQQQGIGGVGQTGGRTDESNLGSGGYGHGMTGQHQPANDPYTAGGTGAAPGIPPSGTINHSDHTSGGGGAGQRITGKVESALGSLVGSNALKAKGLQKEQEANSVKLQTGELAEAERLEREALMRRERAVGHGAHPANAKLGAGTGTGGPGTQN